MINTSIMLQSILFAAALSFLTAISVTASDIVIEISGLRKDAGIARTLLFNSAKGFPIDQFASVSAQDGIIENGKASIVFKNVPAGVYAVSVIHDENINGKLDKRFLGIPKEGVGFSNNIRPFIGPPSFEQAQFTISTTTVKLAILMNYFLK